MERGELVMEACVCSVDGLQYIKERATGTAENAAQLGQQLARQLLDAGAMDILQAAGRQRG
jgi:porphobilinogen deaminase